MLDLGGSFKYGQAGRSQHTNSDCRGLPTLGLQSLWPGPAATGSLHTRANTSRWVQLKLGSPVYTSSCLDVSFDRSKVTSPIGAGLDHAFTFSFRASSSSHSSRFQQFNCHMAFLVFALTSEDSLLNTLCSASRVPQLSYSFYNTAPAEHMVLVHDLYIPLRFVRECCITVG